MKMTNVYYRCDPDGSWSTTPMPETIFSKIIAGDIPCHRVYEDEHVLAFLDIGPLSLGHTLLIPKQCVQHVHELDEAHASALGRVLPRLCGAVMQATGASAYNVLVNSVRGGGAGSAACARPHHPAAR